MGSCQLLTLRSLAQFPAEPPAGREAANIWRTFMREWLQSRDPGRERCTCTHVGPRGRLFPPRPPGLFSSASLAAPLPKGLAPAPSPPSRPGSNRRSLGHWRPRLARGHPRSVGKRHHFQCPWSIPKLQQAARLHSCQ